MKIKSLLFISLIYGTFIIAQGGPGGPGGPGGGHHGGSGHHGDHGQFPGFSDTLTVSGTVILTEDSTHCTVVTRYHLDSDSDGLSDYDLRFGPEWYTPESGATRPAAGDVIDMVGGLVETPNRQFLVVFTLNGEQWLPLDDEGNFVGYGENPEGEQTTVTGYIILEEIPDRPHPRVLLDVENDGEADYGLKLRHWIHQDSTAFLPESGNYVEVTGFLMECDLSLSRIGVVSLTLLEDTGNSDALGIKDGFAEKYRIQHHSFPNPFNPTTLITFEIMESTPVSVTIYDLNGKLVNQLVKKKVGVGTNQVQWDATNIQGQKVSTGLYIYTIQQGNEFVNGKLSYIK
ncbi:MAG: T9SS type A sorting domain-containing protein [Candidatus Marinimicrobia bacterium]|nr:T9SS type A sorting domain-containing protein [Candidatus Neomarinimicrobiota bacterium]